MSKVRPFLVRTALSLLSACVIVLSLSCRPEVAPPEPAILKIGVLADLSGPAATWGQISHHCARVTAAMVNDRGGVVIDGEPHLLEVHVEDTRMEPRLAIAGAERLAIEQGIRYIIGPNVDDTTRAIVPVLESAGAISVSYGFDPALFSRHDGHVILGMVAAAQSAPRVFRYLRDSAGISTVAFVTSDTQDGLSERRIAVAAARDAGLTVMSGVVFDVAEELYSTRFDDVDAVVARTLELEPDAIYFPGLTADAAPHLIRAARARGFTGVLASATSLDEALLRSTGAAAEGFISLGTVLEAHRPSPYFDEFRRRYVELTGDWNAEAGTKAYALELILATLRTAGRDALTDVGVFKAAMPGVRVRDPFVDGERWLRYTGRGSFGQPRQIDLEVVVTALRGGVFEPVLVTGVEDEAR